LEKEYFKRLLVSYLWVGLTFLLNIGRQIVIIPFILLAWGKETYSYWLILISATNLLYTVNHGYLQYIGNEINLHYHQSIQKSISIFKSAFLVLVIQSIILVIIMLILAIPQVFNLLTNINTEDIFDQQVISAFLILGLSSIIYYGMTGLVGKLHEPTGKIYLLYRFSFISQFFEALIFVVLVILKSTLIQAATAVALVRILSITYFGYQIASSYPDFYPWWKGGSLKDGFKNFKSSLLLVYSNFIERFQYEGVTLFVSSFLTITAVPIYSTIRTIGNSAISSISLFVNPTIPDIQKKVANREYHQVLQLLFLNLTVSSLVVNLLFLILAPFISNLYELWTGGELQFDAQFYLAIAYYSIIYCVNYNYFSLLKGINLTKEVLTLVMVKVIVIFILPFFLPRTLSSVGFSIVVSEFLGLMFSLYYSFRELSKSLKSREIINLMLLTALPSCFTLLALYACNAWSLGTIETLILVIPLLIFYLISFYKNRQILPNISGLSLFSKLF
jgi:O-antigen/teichoic acid export membrane protein